MINIYNAKTNFSKLIKEVSAGKQIIIGKAGVPVATLSPFGPQKARKIGALKGQIKIADDFDEIPKTFSDYI